MAGRKLVKCERDGSCGYHAISSFFENGEASILRKWLEKYIEEYKTNLNRILNLDEKEWSLFVARIKKKDGWMTSDIIRALSYLLNRNIFVLDRDQKIITLYPLGPTHYALFNQGPTSIKKDDIVLLLEKYHFDAVK
jgi:hypothetical protein